jgi:hypothetical protein
MKLSYRMTIKCREHQNKIWTKTCSILKTKFYKQTCLKDMNKAQCQAMAQQGNISKFMLRNYLVGG